MAEERDPLETSAVVNTAPPLSETYTAAGKEPEQIHDDIRHTREEMSETIDALGARLEPEYLKDQAVQAVRSTAHDAGTRMIDTLKENPLPTAIAGLSIAWLFMKAGDSDRHRVEIERYDREYSQRYRQWPDTRYTDYRRYPAYYAQAGTSESRGGNGHHLADQAKEKASAAKESVGHAADQVGDQVREWGHDAQAVGRNASNWLERQMNANPLAVGAVAVAAGALVGLAVPETEAENQWMGAQSDRLKDRAGEMANQKIDQAKEVAGRVADEAKEDAKDLADTAQEEAKHEGLTEPPSAGASFKDSGAASTATSGSTTGSGSGGSSSTVSGEENPTSDATTRV